MASPKVAAIVLNYNGREITLQTLASLSRMSYPSFDLVVVDNGSTDGSYEAVAEAFPDVHQIRVEENRGPARGMNRGLIWAMERDYDLLLLLNNDIEVEPAMLTEMVRVLESDPGIGCVGPKAFYYWDRQRLWSTGGIIRFKESVTRERGMGEIDRGRYDHDEEVPYVNGCAMLVRREVVEQIGLWDPLYHLSVEDADWCMRMKRRGWRCHYAHRAVLWHMVSHTTGDYRPGKTFQTGRSTAIFVRRYGGFLDWCSFLLFTALAIPLAWLRELPKGNQGAATAKLKGVVAGLQAELGPPPALPGTAAGGKAGG
ncbi:MAG: glycosyltransferase family 2 protein [Thermoanaerobaculia bacterium]|nr:glycosyltransferase family 2 protein [Thermoanaerobaculia bacterium]